MKVDPCLEALERHKGADPEPALQFLLKFSGLAQKTPRERIGPAIAEELIDQLERALAHLKPLEATLGAKDLYREAVAILQEAVSLTGLALDARAYFPRVELEALGARANGQPELYLLAEALSIFTERHRVFEHRVGWLLSGTSTLELEQLDPRVDCDRIFHALSSSFRIEGRVLELLAINRIAQAVSQALFIRSTREAENNSVGRFYDTYSLFANFFEWGQDSKRGRATIARMNSIHGRYYIPNAGMKYILLQAAFTWLDAAGRIAHRPLLEVERQGYFQAFVKMGRAMNIADVSDHFADMYGWYQEENRRNRQHHPLKTDTFETIVFSSFGPVASAELREALVAAAKAAMDDDFRAALGYEAPSPHEMARVRAVFFTLGQTLALLPRAPHLRSLQSNPARPAPAPPEDLGVTGRSKWLPMIDASRANGGFPEGQKPVPDDTEPAEHQLPQLAWNEIGLHNTLESLWVVVDGYVYDVTSWAALHPGGAEVLLATAGQDASRAFHEAPHSSATQVFKLNYRIGRVGPRGPA